MDTVLQVISDEPVPPRRLNASIPRDLETICLKCLEKEPGKRYASAAALAEDLRRYPRGRADCRAAGGRTERLGDGASASQSPAAALAAAIAGLLSVVALSSVLGVREYRNAQAPARGKRCDRKGARAVARAAR